MESGLLIFKLLIAFQLKHYFCDFPLQTQYMLRKFELGTGGRRGLMPLVCHAGVHGIGSLIILLAFAPQYWPLAAADVLIHGSVDFIKANKNLLGRFGDIKSKPFWNCLGLDQMAHHYTHYGIIFLIWLSKL